MDYGNILIKLRKSKNLSQIDVANELNVSRQSISLWETNQASPSMDNLIALAKLFKVSLDTIVGIETEKNININDYDHLVEYKDNKNIIFRRDYQYINTKKELILFFITIFLFLLSLGLMLRAPSVILDVSKVLLIISFLLIIIGVSIYPLYIYLNLKRQLIDSNDYKIEFHNDYLIYSDNKIKDKKINYEVIDYYIDKKEYLILYVIKDKRIYVPKFNNLELNEYLSKKIDRRTRKKPIWKSL